MDKVELRHVVKVEPTIREEKSDSIFRERMQGGGQDFVVFRQPDRVRLTALIVLELNISVGYVPG